MIINTNLGYLGLNFLKTIYIVVIRKFLVVYQAFKKFDYQLSVNAKIKFIGLIFNIMDLRPLHLTQLRQQGQRTRLMEFQRPTFSLLVYMTNSYIFNLAWSGGVWK